MTAYKIAALYICARVTLNDDRYSGRALDVAQMAHALALAHGFEDHEEVKEERKSWLIVYDAFLHSLTD